VELTAHFNNDAISNEFFMGDGDFDGAGRSYPAAQLPQTGSLTADGIPFLFSNGSEGDLNNVVATGQSIELPPGRYESLHVLGAADTGNAGLTATLTYADGSTAAVALQLTAWLADPSYGETVAVRTTQVHTRTGALGVQAALFHQIVPVDPTRELRSVTLPQPTGPRPHLFALTLERDQT
jgi:alpha-L-fucosidase 2